MIPTQVTYTGPAKSYRCGKFRIKKGQTESVGDPEMLKYLLTVKGFRVVEKPAAPVVPEAPPAAPAAAPPAVEEQPAVEAQPATPSEEAPSAEASPTTSKPPKKTRKAAKRGWRGGGK